MNQKYNETLNELKFVCKSKSAVPVDQVYPLFISLATLWYGWFDHLFLLSFRRGIADTLVSYASFKLPITPLMETLSETYKQEIEPENLSGTVKFTGEYEIIQNASVLMKTSITLNERIDIVHPGNTTNYFKLNVEFGVRVVLISPFVPFRWSQDRG